MAELTRQLADPNVNYLRAQRGVAAGGVAEAVKVVGMGIEKVQGDSIKDGLKEDLEGLKAPDGSSGNDYTPLFVDHNSPEGAVVSKYEGGKVTVGGMSDLQKNHFDTTKKQIDKYKRIISSNPRQAESYRSRVEALVKTAVNRMPSIAGEIKQVASSTLGYDYEQAAKDEAAMAKEARADSKKRLDAMRSDALSLGVLGAVDTEEGLREYLRRADRRSRITDLEQGIKLRDELYKSANYDEKQKLDKLKHTADVSTAKLTAQKNAQEIAYNNKFWGSEANMKHKKAVLSYQKAVSDANKAAAEANTAGGDPVLKKLYKSSPEIRSQFSISYEREVMPEASKIFGSEITDSKSLSDAMFNGTAQQKEQFTMFLKNQLAEKNNIFASTYRGAFGKSETNYKAFRDGIVSPFFTTAIESMSQGGNRYTSMAEQSKYVTDAYKRAVNSTPGYQELQTALEMQKMLSDATGLPANKQSAAAKEMYGRVNKVLESLTHIDPNGYSTGAKFNIGSVPPKDAVGAMDTLIKAGSQATKAGRPTEIFMKPVKQMISSMVDNKGSVDSSLVQKGLIDKLNSTVFRKSLVNTMASDPNFKHDVQSVMVDHLQAMARAAQKSIEDGGGFTPVLKGLWHGEDWKRWDVVPEYDNGRISFKSKIKSSPESAKYIAELNKKYAKPLNNAIASFDHIGVNAESTIASVMVGTPWEESFSVSKSEGRKATPSEPSIDNETLKNSVYPSESRGSYSAVNKDTDASGKYQMMPKTAAPYLKKLGKTWADFKNFKDPENEALQEQVMDMDIETRTKYMKEEGIKITPFTYYMAHQQGARGLGDMFRIMEGKRVSDKEYKRLRQAMKQNAPKGWDKKDGTESEFLAKWEAQWRRDTNNAQASRG